jgi:hypothetical protein
MSRLKLISLLSFNAIAAAVIVAQVTFLLSSKDEGPSALQLACLDDSGASATGAGQLAGDRGFATVEEAETFICHRIAYPRDLNGWLIEDISAMRRSTARDTALGQGFASVTLNYVLGRSKADLRIEVSPFAIDRVEYGVIDKVRIMGATAELIKGLDSNHVILQWRSNGYSFYTEARLTDEFSMADLLAVLNSIE